MRWYLVRNTHKDRPRVGKFFLANTVCGEVMIDASTFLSDFDIAIHLVDGNAVIGPEPPVKGLPFVSCRAMAKKDPRWDTIRMKILRQITDKL